MKVIEAYDGKTNRFTRNEFPLISVQETIISYNNKAVELLRISVESSVLYSVDGDQAYIAVLSGVIKNDFRGFKVRYLDRQNKHRYLISTLPKGSRLHDLRGIYIIGFDEPVNYKGVDFFPLDAYNP